MIKKNILLLFYFIFGIYGIIRFYPEHDLIFLIPYALFFPLIFVLNGLAGTIDEK